MRVPCRQLTATRPQGQRSWWSKTTTFVLWTTSGSLANPGPRRLARQLLSRCLWLVCAPLVSVCALGTSLPHPSPARRVPETIPCLELTDPALPSRAIPLPEVDFAGQQARAHGSLAQQRLVDGSVHWFRPQWILVKFRALPHVCALGVEPAREVEAIDAVGSRPDVEFATLDRLEERQFTPNDPLFTAQWHHAILGSADAWNLSLGSAAIQVAIVDTPFQMNHPDLATNTVPGWDAVTGEAVLQSPGISHSTAGAGMVAGVINNGIGVAGVGKCGILPINVTGFVSEMYNAVVWAADHGVRLVNISWSGANEPTLETAGQYLETHARGLLVMSGVNGTGFLNYTNQPHIYCVSMTDAADNLQSHYGNHIDFAAPGYAVPTTTVGSSYTTATGTSFSAPLFSGVAAVLLDINPTLSPPEVIEILRTTADDLGPAGWDVYFGWGRIHFGRAAAAARATLPRVQTPRVVAGVVELTASFRAGLRYSLWRTPMLTPANWQPVLSAPSTTNGSSITFSDTPPSGVMSYYRIAVEPSPGS